MLGALVVDWSQLTVGVAALVALVYVARTMKRILHETLTFVGNHMSEVTKVQAQTAQAMGHVAGELRELNVRTEQLHDDNMETAEKLAQTSHTIEKLVTRKVDIHVAATGTTIPITAEEKTT